MIETELVKADGLLASVSRKLRLVQAVRPLNEAEQKALFLRGEVVEPDFVYSRPPTTDTSEIRKLRLPDSSWGKLLEAVRRRLLRLNSLFEEPGPINVRDFSREVYGAPNQQLQAVARNLLARIEVEPRPEVSFEFTREILEKALADYGLDGWKVKRADGDFTAARAVEKTVYLTGMGGLYEGTAERLAVHEVGVHAVRAYNGAGQDLSHFSLGWPGYEQAEEGLAVYAELHTGTISQRALLNYSARVLAVASLDKGLTFRGCYEFLRDLNLTEVQAWEATLRAYRGHGFFKDHIYLQGLLDVFAFMKNGGKWESLFVGKVGLEHLGLVDRALNRGVLRPPRVIPGFFQCPPVRGKVWKLIEGLVD